MELHGAVTVVTGAGGGIGRSLTTALRTAGSTVVTTDVAGEVDHRLDVTDLDAVRGVLDAVRREHGGLDVVVANAGIGVGGLVEDVVPTDWARSIAVNVGGTANTVQAAYPLLLAQGSGAIVLVASLSGLLPTPLLTTYSMTKHAIVGLGASLRTEAARHGVGVTVVCPGPVETPLLDAPSSTGGLSVRRYLTAAAGPPLSPDRLAAAVVDGVRRDRALVVPGRAALLSRLARFAPGATSKVIARNVDKELGHAE